jgi:glycosyltransferase involved in cell wall biosynthesis
MNLLVLSDNPDRASFRQRIGIYLDVLRTAGLDCKVERFPSNPFAGWKLLRTGADFDAVFLHKKRLNPFDALVLRRCARKIIYDFDDAIMYSDKHPDKPSSKRLKSFRRTVELADLVIAGNAYLAEHARRFNANVEILPTGLDVSEYDVNVSRPADGKIRLVWIGSKPTLPYLKEIKPALEEIGSSIDDVVLRIICDEFFDLNNRQIEKRQWSRQTEVIDLVTSDIGLAPLPDNLFTRGKCGFKILQYQAAGLPVVVSSVGVNAELVRDGFNGYHAVSMTDWVRKIYALVKDKSLRTRMGQAAIKSCEPFDLAALSPRLVTMITSVIAASK